MRPTVVGVDFDNTIIDYKDLLRAAAVRSGVTPEAPLPDKKAVREAVRRLPDGERKWQAIQAETYGPRIGEARPFAGAADFFKGCRSRGIPIHVVSHKTTHAAEDRTGTNLREVARDWLDRRDFLSGERAAVHFADTLEGKLALVRELHCTHMVDDLEETFLHPTFPEETKRILFRADGSGKVPAGVEAAQSWHEVARIVFAPGP